jgi:hypothetical protein
MSQIFNIKIKQVSLFPLLIKNSSNFYTKIYTKYWLYYLCLIELNKNNESYKYKLNHNRINTKVLKGNTQTLRSPNRHKVAQFHTTKRHYETITTLQLSLKNTSNINILNFSAFILSTLIMFESSSSYIKNIKLIAKIYLPLFLNIHNF